VRPLDDMHDRGDPHSLAPIQLENASVQQEAAQLKRGRGLPLVLNLTVLVAVATAAGQWLNGVDTRNSYNHAAAQLDRSETMQAESFMRCVLPDLQPTQLTSTVTLYGTIENLTEQLGKAYGDQVAACAPMLEDFERTVHGVRAPADMTRHLQQISLAASGVKQSWQTYQQYLQTPNQPYDYVKAAPLIDRITVAWQTYHQANSEIKQALGQAR
jgi:hypothetical protein